jgi:amino acid permease
MNFKKSTALIVACLMLVSNAGFAMTVHYCGGKISSVSSGFNSTASCEIPEIKIEKVCCAKKMEISHKKCCSDKVLHFKGKVIDIIAKAFSSEMATPFVIPAFSAIIFASAPELAIQKLPSYHCEAHAPPLFKLYSQFVFYA